MIFYLDRDSYDDFSDLSRQDRRYKIRFHRHAANWGSLSEGEMCPSPIFTRSLRHRYADWDIGDVHPGPTVQ